MKMLRDFWFSTGTPTYLIRLLSHNNEQINDLTGKYYQSGYLALTSTPVAEFECANIG